MTTAYRAFEGPSETAHLVRTLSAVTAIFDVEPLIAFWDTGDQVLTAGVTAILDQFAADPGHLRHVVLATNSARRLPALPFCDGLHLDYLALARKPLRTAPYRHLPGPGVVIGDQIATDGVLAWRLGYTFLHFTPEDLDIPVGPRIMSGLGRPLRRLLFHR